VLQLIQLNEIVNRLERTLWHRQWALLRFAVGSVVPQHAVTDASEDNWWDAEATEDNWWDLMWSELSCGLLVGATRYDWGSACEMFGLWTRPTIFSHCAQHRRHVAVALVVLTTARWAGAVYEVGMCAL